MTSFIKRRLGLVSGDHAPGLDQVLESLLPLFVVQPRFDLALSGMLGVEIAFIILDLIFWRYYSRLYPSQPLPLQRKYATATIFVASA